MTGARKQAITGGRPCALDYHDNCKPGWVSSVVTLARAKAPNMPCDVMATPGSGAGAGTGTGTYVISSQPEVCGRGLGWLVGVACSRDMAALLWLFDQT